MKKSKKVIKDIVEKVKENFGISSEEAEAKFIAFVNEVDVEQMQFAFYSKCVLALSIEDRRDEM